MTNKITGIVIGAAAIFLLTPAIAQDYGSTEETPAPISAAELANLIGETPPPTSPALILPLSALENPDVAAAISPVAVDPDSGVAIEGYDPVGYFTERKAMLGSPQFTAEFRGAKFHFASEQNRELFIENPERFAPAYGGYCTQSLASGQLTPASPTHWTIHGDRLFLTRSAATTKAFREETALVVEAAQRNYDNSPLAGSNKFNFDAHN